MKKELLKLYEGSPTSFVESIKSKLEEKALNQIAEDVNANAAQSIFNEGWKDQYKDPKFTSGGPAVQPKNTGNWKNKYKQPGETEENYRKRMASAGK